MAQNKLSMRQIQEILRLRHQNHLSVREIARSCGLPTSTVGDYLQRAQGAGLTWPLPEGLSELQLHEQLMAGAPEAARRQILPLAKPLLRHLESLPAGDDPNAPLFPKACASKECNPHGGPVSNQFYGILAAAGLVKARTHKGKGKGRDAKRQLNEISFHSLRHTATSLLKNAGVSDVIARDIIGHDSAAVSANYTHIDQRTKRGALDKLPDVTK